MNFWLQETKPSVRVLTKIKLKFCYLIKYQTNEPIKVWHPQLFLDNFRIFSKFYPNRQNLNFWLNFPSEFQKGEKSMRCKLNSLNSMKNSAGLEFLNGKENKALRLQSKNFVKNKFSRKNIFGPSRKINCKWDFLKEIL